jgi:DNA-binding NarL/FixJ family response regulator
VSGRDLQYPGEPTAPLAPGAVVDAATVKPPQPALPAGKSVKSALTDRQSDIVELLATGMVHKKIAADLGISDRTLARDIAAIKTWHEMAQPVI